MRTLYRAAALHPGDLPEAAQPAALVVEGSVVAWLGSDRAAASLAGQVDAVWTSATRWSPRPSWTPTCT